jgi:hypothetical protein
MLLRHGIPEDRTVPVENLDPAGLYRLPDPLARVRAVLLPGRWW